MRTNTCFRLLPFGIFFEGIVYFIEILFAFQLDILGTLMLIFKQRKELEKNLDIELRVF